MDLGFRPIEPETSNCLLEFSHCSTGFGGVVL